MPSATAKQPQPASGIVRVGSNYARLATTFALGLIQVRVLLAFGSDAYGLILLVMAGAGSLIWLRESLNAGTMPALAAAFHSQDDARFRQTYNSALLLSILSALLSTILFGSIYCCLPLLKIPKELIGSARWVLAAMAAQMFCNLLLATTLNVLVVSERMVVHNCLLIAQRVGEVIVAFVCVLLTAWMSVTIAVSLWGVLTAATTALVLFTAAVCSMLKDSRLLPHLAYVNRSDLRMLFRYVGWNTGQRIANVLYLRLDAFVMNLVFGLFGNVIFGIAVQLCGYVRQLSMGLVVGLDATSARLAATDEHSAAIRLLHRSTRLQAAVILPATCILVLFTEPILTLWVGPRLEDPATMLPAISTTVRWMILGVAARSLSEAWMTVLSGQGAVHRYAPIVILGGVLNLPVVLLLLWLVPQELKFAAPAMAYAVLLIMIHLGVLPMIVARCCATTYRGIISPIFPPLLVTIASLCVASLIWLFASASTLNLLLSLLLFAITYSALTYLLILDRRERDRIAEIALRLRGIASLRGRTVQLHQDQL